MTVPLATPRTGGSASPPFRAVQRPTSLSAELRPAAQGARAGLLPYLTPDASPETVLGWARIFARRFEPFGALERDDLVSIGCLRFYLALERWRDHIGDFGAWAATYMRGGMGEALRREAHGKGDAQPRPRRSRAAQRRAHNQDYYVRHGQTARPWRQAHAGLQMCDICGEPVGLGHGARRCDAHTSRWALHQRQARERRRAAVA